jgi:hypothetical protein
MTPYESDRLLHKESKKENRHGTQPQLPLVKKWRNNIPSLLLMSTHACLRKLKFGWIPSMTDVKEEKNTSTRSLERVADYYIQKARYKTATVLVLHGENVLTHLMSVA